MKKDLICIVCPRGCSVTVEGEIGALKVTGCSCAKGEQYAMPTKMEDMYRELVACYEGDLRDYVLYTLLRNFIMNGKEIERADALYKDYIEKYNTSTFHKGILEMLLQ